jgi:hypothetical protein
MHGSSLRSAADGPRGVPSRPAPGPVVRPSFPPAAPPPSPAPLGRIAFPSVRGEDEAPLEVPRGRRFTRGLPYLEFALTCAVVTVLVFLGLREYHHAVLRARAATAAADLSVMRDGLLRYYSDCHDFPVWDGRPGDPGLLRAPAAVAGAWGGPYLRRWPESTPLGGRYSYHRHLGLAQDAVLEVEGVGRAEALELARALGGGVVLELAPMRAGSRDPESWTVRLDLARRLGT